MKPTTKAKVQLTELRERVDGLEAKLDELEHASEGLLQRIRRKARAVADGVSDFAASRVDAVRSRWRGDVGE